MNRMPKYRLLVFPLLLGDGKRMFDGGHDLVRLALGEVRATPSGVVLLTYRPADPSG